MIEEVNKILEFIVQNKLVLIDWHFSVGDGYLRMHIKNGIHVIFITMDEENCPITKKNFERKYNHILADKV